MGSYVIRLKVLPQEVDIPHEKVIDSVTNSLPQGVQIKGHRIEPIAYGLSAIVLDVVAPEEEGVIDKVEHSVSTAPLVGQYELVGVSRMSSKLPPS
jgi:elongation factor 1-beta